MNWEPGWYDDPFFHLRERYWDGSNWSDEVRLAPTEQPVPTSSTDRPKQEAATTPDSGAAHEDRPTASTASTASTAATAAAAAARASDRGVRTSDPVTATYPKTEPVPNDPMITGVVPAQPEPQPDDPMITGVVPAQPAAPLPPMAPPPPPSPPAAAAPVVGRTVSGSVPPTPPPATKVADESPLMQISSRPVNPLSDPLTTMNIAAPKTDHSSRRRWMLLVGGTVIVLVVVAVGAYLAFGASSARREGAARSPRWLGTRCARSQWTFPSP